MGFAYEPLTTPRLHLVPFDDDTARAVLAGDLGDLGGLVPGEGWPHEHTANGLSRALEHGDPAGWMVVLEDRVIGDCGTHGPPGAEGQVEIGYGLAAPFRGRGLGTEMVAAMSGWLLDRDDVRFLVARTVPDNLPSRQVLEKNGFRLTAQDDGGYTAYRRDR